MEHRNTQLSNGAQLNTHAGAAVPLPNAPSCVMTADNCRDAVPGSGPRLAQAAAHDGAVNKEAEATKRLRYPDRQAPCRVVPFALETYGRLGRTALLHLRKLARAQAQRLDEGADGATSALLQRWGCRLSVALHRANSEALRSALGKEAGAHAAKLDLGADLAA